MGKIKKICMMVVLAGSIVISGNCQTQAVKKKLSVNKVYDTTTKVTGKTSKNSLVKIKIGKKVYKKRATKNGKFKIKIPVQKVGKTFWVRSYHKKNEKWKFLKKQKVHVLTKNLKVERFSKKARIIKGYARPGIIVGINLVPIQENICNNGSESYPDGIRGAAVNTNKYGRFVIKFEEKIGNCIAEIECNRKNDNNNYTVLKKTIRPYDL